MIIDIHMHLGDILHMNGGSIISQNIPMPQKFNIQRFEEKFLRFNGNFATRWLFKLLDDNYTKSVQDRIKAGTINNLKNHFDLLTASSKDLFGDNKVFCACMPISPYVSFNDIYEYSLHDKRILPFTSFDPMKDIDTACSGIESSKKNCFGLKLHPIIQGFSFDSNVTFSVLDVFKKTSKPVLFHAGASRYYLGNEKTKQHCELDNIEAAKTMVKRYPTIPFIMGHAGIAEYKEWAEAFKNIENVYVDITVQSVKTIREIVNMYGEERVLFASDWPCIDSAVTIDIVKNALSSSQLHKCMYKNALNILNIR